jgi:hypothetical protein
MSYDVAWRPVAEQQLARICNAAADRSDVTRASHEIDQDLARDPRSVGESRTGATRILVKEPLVALYEIVEDDRRVWVLKVWRA